MFPAWCCDWVRWLYQPSNSGRCRPGRLTKPAVRPFLEPLEDRQVLSHLPAGVFQFSAASYTVREEAGSITIAVTRTGGSNGEVWLQAKGAFALTDGGGWVWGNYPAANLQFLDGMTQRTYTLNIPNDNIPEPNRSLTISLGEPFNIGPARHDHPSLGSPATAELIVLDDDYKGTLQFSAAAYEVAENADTATFTVTRTGGSPGPVTVNYATSGGTATAGADYTAVSGTLDFAAHQSSKTFTVPLRDDPNFEGDETVTLALSAPTGGAVLGGQSTAVLSISDRSRIAFSAPSYITTETGSGVTVFVRRTGDTDGACTVEFATADGTATAGIDYTPVVQVLTFAAQDANPKTITVPVRDDASFEGNETFHLTLSNVSSGGTLGVPFTAVVTILEDEAAPPAPPPVVRAVSAVLTTVPRGKSRRLVVRIAFGGGGPPRLIVSPFQKPTFQGARAALHDLDGDGVFDSVLFTARRGMKRVRRVLIF